MKSDNLTIFTDATCDLPQKLIDELGIKVIPMSCMVDEKNYTGTKDDYISAKEVYDGMRSGKRTSTGQIAPAIYEEYFSAELSQGKDILHINLSSGLTGSFEQAKTVQKQLAQTFPNNKIYLIDSLSGSLGEGLIVYKTAKYYNKHKDTKKTYEYAQELVKSVCAIFTVDDLKYLRAGGRISTTKAIIGTLLHLKPIIYANTEGKLTALSNVIGRKKALKTLVQTFEKTYISEKNNVIMIGHADCLEEAESVGQMIKQKHGINNIIYNFIGPVMGSHCGPGTVALFFEGNNKGVSK